MQDIEKIEQDILKTTEFLGAKYLDNYLKIENVLNENKGILLEQIQISLQKGIDKAITIQKIGKKGKIKYISLSLLLSSILTQDYSIGIDFYNENFYLDEQTVFTEIKIELVKELIKEYVNTDIDKLKIYHRQEKIMYPENDYIEIRKMQSMTYMLLYMKWIIENIQKAVRHLEIKNMQTEEKIDFTYGLYLEKHEIIYQWEI